MRFYVRTPSYANARHYGRSPFELKPFAKTSPLSVFCLIFICFPTPDPTPTPVSHPWVKSESRVKSTSPACIPRAVDVDQQGHGPWSKHRTIHVLIRSPTPCSRHVKSSLGPERERENTAAAASTSTAVSTSTHYLLPPSPITQRHFYPSRTHQFFPPFTKRDPSINRNAGNFRYHPGVGRARRRMEQELEVHFFGPGQ
jgi:hypothetical protein